MALPEPLFETLVQVADAMRPAQAPWWVIGSAAVALLGGGPVEAADVDVLMSAADADAVLGALGVAGGLGAADALFRSTIFARWDAPPRPVEFMCGLAVNTGERWAAVRPTTREAVRVGGAMLFTPSVQELRRILLLFGRPKDHERAALLRG